MNLHELAEILSNTYDTIIANVSEVDQVTYYTTAQFYKLPLERIATEDAAQEDLRRKVRGAWGMADAMFQLPLEARE